MISPAPPRSTHSLRVDGSRRVGWAEWGPPQGRPVLFCTGAGLSSSLGFGAHVLDELGVRLLCVDRAGLGRSDPDPDKTLDSYARDVARVLESQGIERPAVVGYSQGAPFAVALGGAGVASALALVAGTDELSHPRLRHRLAPDVIRLIDAIAADPAGFEASFAERADAESMWTLILSMSSAVDRALYEHPDFASVFRQSLAEGFAQGPGGYVRDLVLASSPWPTAPERVSVPVHLWYGELDSSPVHSPDFGQTLCARFPSATLHTLPDEGSALLWTRSREILAELVEAR